MQKSVVVIGGGIVGLSCAYYLQKAGHQVTLIDKGQFNEGTSHINAGYLTPSHIIPLAAPGMVQKGLRWMTRPDSPFYIQPRFDLNLFRWGWKFMWACSHKHVDKSLEVIRDINLLSKDLYIEMKYSKDIDFQLESKGLLMAYQSSKIEKEEAKVAQKARALGLEVRQLDRTQLQQYQPEVQMHAAGAFYYTCDAHTTPGLFMQQLLAFVKQAGVDCRAQTTVTGFIYQNQTIKGVQTTQGAFTADEYVMAAGVWSEDVLRPLGIRIALQAGKGYAISTTQPTGISLPAILLEPKIAVTPMQGFTRFAGTMELSGINHQIHPHRVAAIARGVADFYPQLNLPQADIANAKCGLRPLSPDGLPYIGKHPNCDNLTLATGHAMMGWSLGPATGKLVAELISGQKTSMALDPFSPLRKTG